MVHTRNAVDEAATECRAMAIGRGLALAAAVLILAAQACFVPVILDVLQFGRLGVRAPECDAQSVCKIERISPGSTAEKAGLRVGDGFRIDDPGQRSRSRTLALMPGEAVPVTLKGQQGERRIVLTAQAASWTGKHRGLQIVDIQLCAVSILAVLLGAFLALRSRGRPSVLLLSAAVILSCAWGTPAPYWLNEPRLYFWSNGVMTLLIALGPVLFLAFVARYRRETTGGGGDLTRWTLLAYAAAQFAIFCAMQVLSLQGRYQSDSPLATIYGVMMHLALPLTLAVMITGRREAAPEQRDRFGLMIPAVVLFMAFPNMGLLVEWSPMKWRPENPVVILTMILPLAGLLGLIYAVLRHRIIDLGFVINRTLIYGVLSTVLVLAFWFAEWGLEELIPDEGRFANVLVSAGVAFVLFLVFERARERVKEAVEHLFFRRWRENEAYLRRFVREAVFFTREAALLSASLAELSRFSAGARVALFQPADAAYHLRGGDAGPEVADRLDPDQPALVRLRADRVLQDRDLPGQAELLVPVVLRSEIAGFFLFGPKPTGEQYRPDEQDALCDAAQKLGQSLQTLEIEAQARTLDQLESQNQQLRLALSLVGAERA